MAVSFYKYSNQAKRISSCFVAIESFVLPTTATCPRESLLFQATVRFRSSPSDLHDCSVRVKTCSFMRFIVL